MLNILIGWFQFKCLASFKYPFQLDLSWGSHDLHGSDICPIRGSGVVTAIWDHSPISFLISLMTAISSTAHKSMNFLLFHSRCCFASVPSPACLSLVMFLSPQSCSVVDCDMKENNGLLCRIIIYSFSKFTMKKIQYTYQGHKLRIGQGQRREDGLECGI